MLMGKGKLCNIDNLLRWTSNKQMKLEGGFQVGKIGHQSMINNLDDQAWKIIYETILLCSKKVCFL